jgi:hypothetical protein
LQSRSNAILRREIANLKFIKRGKFSIQLAATSQWKLQRGRMGRGRKVFTKKSSKEGKSKREAPSKSHCCSIADLNSQEGEERSGKKSSRNAKQNNISFALLFTFIFK